MSSSLCAGHQQRLGFIVRRAALNYKSRDETEFTELEMNDDDLKLTPTIIDNEILKVGLRSCQFISNFLTEQQPPYHLSDR